MHTQKLIFLSGGGRGGGIWGIAVVNARIHQYMNAVYLIGRNVLLNKQITQNAMCCTWYLNGIFVL